MIISPNPVGGIFTDCGGVRYLGGAEKFSSANSLEKSYSGLAPHFMFYLKIIILKVDDWSSQSGIKIYVDDSLIRTENLFSLNDAAWSINSCGDQNQLEQEILIDQSFFHSQETLKIRIEKTGENPLEYWGLLKIELKIYKCNPTCKKCKDGVTCSDCLPDQIYSNNRCNCLSG